MRTQKQIAASRANGARSNGPATPEGKLRSSRNATTHGLFSDSILLRNENKEAWDNLCRGLLARFDPVDDIERAAVYQLAAANWRRERAEIIEAAALDMELDAVNATEAPSLTARDERRKVAVAHEKAIERSRGLVTVQRESSRLSRQEDRLIERLLKLQRNRPAALENENGENEPGAVEPPLHQADSKEQAPDAA